MAPASHLVRVILLEGVTAAFRKAHGIAPAGAGPHAPSDYGFPLPPADHPNALSFAQAIVRRAPQNTRYPQLDVERQVRKAKRIIRQKRREAIADLSAITGVRALVQRRAREAVELPGDAAPAAIKPQTVLALRESTSDGIVPDVLLIRSGPGNLGDRHYYTDACIQRAAFSGVFEGAKCYLDHPTPTDEREQPGRSVRTLGGWYSDVSAKPHIDSELGECTGLYANFHPQVGEERVLGLVRTCVEYAERYPAKAYVGLSISALGASQPDDIDGETWNRVDEITKVESVDIVTQAGAGGTFLPLRESYYMPKDKKDGIKLVLDSDKLAEGVRSTVRGTVVQLLESAGGKKLSEEQLKDLDEKLKTLTPEQMDALVEKSTKADPDDDDDDKDKDTEDVDEVDKKDDDDEDPFAADKTKSPKLHAAWKTELGKRKAAEKKAREASTIAESAKGRVDRVERERIVEKVLNEGNYPEHHVPRLRRILLESSAKKLAEFQQIAKDEDMATIRPQIDGAGAGPLREGAKTPVIKVDDFNFDVEG